MRRSASPRLGYTLAASLGVGLLLKSLIAMVFPWARRFFTFSHPPALLRRHLEALLPLEQLAIILLIAAPWHILATLANPPYLCLHAA
jgi:hypothetical protein